MLKCKKLKSVKKGSGRRKIFGQLPDLNGRRGEAGADREQGGECVRKSRCVRRTRSCRQIVSTELALGVNGAFTGQEDVQFSERV